MSEKLLYVVWQVASEILIPKKMIFDQQVLRESTKETE